jgi:hypothetical protein
VVDDRDIQITEKLGDRVSYSETDTVSPDGSTLQQNLTDSAAPNDESVIAQETYTRITASPPGANPISGSWQLKKIKVISENGATVTYHSTPDGLEASNPSGEGYRAKFDGKEYAIHGDPSHSTVSLQRINERTIVEIDRQDGVIHYKLRMTVSANGKSMKVTEMDGERGTKMTYVMDKKPS